MGNFDAKDFNSNAFKYRVGRIPNLVGNEIVKSRAIVEDRELTDTMKAQNGVSYVSMALRGLLDGDAVNYDGATNITATSTKSFTQSYQVVGRAKAWTEKDFAYDVTGGVDFMDNVASQVGDYKQALDEKTILAVLKGVFSMSSGTKNLEFVDKHTTQISGNVGATTLNSAANKACGKNKSQIALVFIHPDVATNLENLNVLEYLKYTDKDGITRDLPLATWNGKTVVVTEDVPVDVVYELTKDVAIDATKTYYTKSGDDYVVVAEPDVDDIATYYEQFEDYTTYALGVGSIVTANPGAKVPYEMSRDPKTNGGEDTLYMRQRKVFALKGISYTKSSQSSESPTDAELATGSNWELVHSGEAVAANRSYINHKAIAAIRIISRG